MAPQSGAFLFPGRGRARSSKREGDKNGRHEVPAIESFKPPT
jgi:hypothetical protein